MSKTIDRIRKLLSLATSDNAHEADTAKRLAAALMRAAGITETDLHGSAEEVPPESTVLDQATNLAMREVWRRDIVIAVCRVVGVYVYVGREGTAHIVGTAAAREAAVELIGWVLDQVSAATRAVTPPPEYVAAGEARAWMHSYRTGLVEGIAAQALALVQARERAPIEPMALARRDAVAAAIEAARPKGLRTIKARSRRVYRSGLVAGRTDSAAVALQRRAAGSTQRHLGAGSGS